MKASGLQEQIKQSHKPMMVIKPGGTYFVLGLFICAFTIFMLYLRSARITLYGLWRGKGWMYIFLLLLSIWLILKAILDRTEFFEDGFRVKRLFQDTEFYRWEELGEIKTRYKEKAIKRPKYPDEITFYCNNNSVASIYVEFSDGAEKLIDYLRENGYLEE